MIVHSYYYGPIGNEETGLETTSNLTKIVNEDVIRDLYSRDGNPKKQLTFSNVINTLKGPVLAVTRIFPAQGHRDKRATFINRTLFVRLEDVVNDLTCFLDDPATFPLQSFQAELRRK